MKHPFSTASLIGAALAALIAAPAHAFDEDAAKALAKKNDCTKCHAVDKTKKGPAFKKVAEKYKGKAEGPDKIYANLTTGPKVKLEDGSEENHKIIEAKDKAEINNLIAWILSR